MPVIIGEKKEIKGNPDFRIIDPQLEKKYKFSSQNVDERRVKDAFDEIDLIDEEEYERRTKPVAPELIKEVMTELYAEERAQKDGRMRLAMEQAKEQAALRKWGAPIRFKCSVPAPEFEYARQKDSYYWSDPKHVRKWMSDYNYMSGDK